MAAKATNAYKKTARQQETDNLTKELTAKLETGITELFSSDKYRDYLKSMSNFHNYSSRNIMLIHQQLPTATRVASYKVWTEKFNRQVIKGQKSLRIFAPIEIKPKTQMMEKLDPLTNKPILDEHGKPMMEKMTELPKRDMAYKLVPVFDVSQTHGDPLPHLAEDLTGNVAHYEAFLDTLKAISPLPIEIEPMADGPDGYCRYGVKIGIREGMSEVQTVSAILHEITHAQLHDKANLAENATPLPQHVREIEAESVSYVVCQKYGIETGENSFGYLASWSHEDLGQFKASLDMIRKEANGLILAIDDKFKSICKERGIDLTAEQSQQQPQRTATKAPEEPPEYTTESTTQTIAGVDFSFEEVKPIVPEKGQTATITSNTTSENTSKPTIEQQNFNKLSELFPQIVNDEFSYQRMEAGAGFMPLSLEWIDDNQLSIMHTYVQDGDLMYDPMIVFDVDREAKTATAVEFQQSNPPLYQRIEDGIGHSIDGNGNERTINGLQGQINDFASQWFENIGNQDYVPVTTVLRESEYADESVFFNSEPMPPMPDPTISIADMETYGYTAEDMLPLQYDRAIDLFKQDHTIFLLFNDGTESMAFDSSEIVDHDGIYGIEREEWQNSNEFKELSAQSEQAASTVEQNAIEDKESLPSAPPDQSSLPNEPSEEPPTTETPDTPKSEQPIYKQHSTNDLPKEEWKAFFKSQSLNIECGTAIDNAIIASNYEQHRYDLKAAARDVIETFGADRVAWVLASNINDSNYDGRLSSATKAWAEAFDTPKPDVYLKTHLAVLNGFVDNFRKVEKEKPSLMAALKTGEEKSKVQIGADTHDKSVQKKKNEMEV